MLASAAGLSVGSFAFTCQWAAIWTEMHWPRQGAVMWDAGRGVTRETREPAQPYGSGR